MKKIMAAIYRQGITGAIRRTADRVSTDSINFCKIVARPDRRLLLILELDLEGPHTEYLTNQGQ